MNAKLTLLSILGMLGIGNMPGLPESKPPRKITQADLDRIKEAKLKRLRKQVRQINNKAP